MPIHVGASGKGLSPTFYSHKGPYWRTTHDATVTTFMDAFKDSIMQILHEFDEGIWLLQLFHGFLPVETFASVELHKNFRNFLAEL